MDNISSYDTFANFFRRKEKETGKPIYGHLAFWSQRDSWKNKYQLKEWFEKLGIPDSISTWLAKDVFVVFTDAWHFFKAIGIVAILYSYVVEFSTFLGINFWLCYFITFSLTGIVFNFLFYSLRKIK